MSNQTYTQPAPLPATDLQLQYESIFRRERSNDTQPARRQSPLWVALIPQIVPSIATYGAFEDPI